MLQIFQSFTLKSFSLSLVLVLAFNACSEAHSGTGVALGPEYVEYRRSATGEMGSDSAEASLQSRLLYYIPNRILDAIDVVRADVGVGPSFGAVVRVTEVAQLGYRVMTPASLRVGLRGRRLPVFLERSSEFGAGPAYLESPERSATPFEVGVGADLFLVGAYLGVSLDELFDFVVGIFTLDPSDDDLR